jgi:uncharacterized protein YkwD
MPSLTRRGFIVLGAATALSACATALPLTPAIGNTPETLTDAQIMTAINAVRAANGAPAWSYSPGLEAAARSHAQLMASRNKLSHDLGITLRERVTAAGYLGAVGENLAGGHPTLESAIGGWMQSSGHRSTLLSPKFTEFGLAAARASSGKLYWALIAGGSFDAWRVYG